MTTCFAVVRGKVVRVVELDACGAVVTGTGRMVVSDGFIQVALTSELEAGDEYVQKNADGALCVNERAPDNLKRLNVTTDWCNVDPDLINIITGYPIEEGTSPGDAVGFRIEEGLADTRYALELWTGLANADCSDGDVPYGYVLLPRITGSTLGDITVGNSTVTFQTTGYTEGNSGWGVGPFDVINDPAGPLDDPIASNQHALIRVTTVAPPTASCGATLIP